MEMLAGGHIAIYVYRINTLNFYCVICQLYINLKKKEERNLATIL